MGRPGQSNGTLARGPEPGDGRRTLEDDVHFACRRVVDAFTLKQLGDREDLPTTGPQATGGGGLHGRGRRRPRRRTAGASRGTSSQRCA